MITKTGCNIVKELWPQFLGNLLRGKLVNYLYVILQDWPLKFTQYLFIMDIGKLLWNFYWVTIKLYREELKKLVQFKIRLRLWDQEHFSDETFFWQMFLLPDWKQISKMQKCLRRKMPIFISNLAPRALVIMLINNGFHWDFSIAEWSLSLFCQACAQQFLFCIFQKQLISQFLVMHNLHFSYCQLIYFIN